MGRGLGGSYVFMRLEELSLNSTCSQIHRAIVQAWRTWYLIRERPCTTAASGSGTGRHGSSVASAWRVNVGPGSANVKGSPTVP